MIESVKQVHTDECGNIDKARGGAGGKSKNRRDFLEAMRSSGRSEFELTDLQQIADRLNIGLGSFKDFVQGLRDNGEIMWKSSGVYTLVS